MLTIQNTLIVFLLLLNIIFSVFLYKKNIKENFETIDSQELKNEIEKIINVESLKNLSDIASKLVSGGDITIPGKVIATNGFRALGGTIQIDKGNIFTNDGNISTDKGVIYTSDGNISTDKGNIYTSDGSISTGKGNIYTNNGDIEVDKGNIYTNNGDISSNNGFVWASRVGTDQNGSDYKGICRRFTLGQTYHTDNEQGDCS
jgi:hypothetical protein